jgi:carbonic anhydrase
MSLISEILDHNHEFVEKKQYEPFLTDRYPNKRIVILTCMDTRLVELLPRAMNFRNGDVKIIKNAGAIVSHPFGSAMRSILVAVYELNADEVAVVGHHDCGMTALKSDVMLDNIRKRGISEDVLSTLQNAGIDLNRWLTGFANIEEGVKQSVQIIRNHPLLPRDLPVHGLVIDSTTGKLELVTDGYSYSR